MFWTSFSDKAKTSGSPFMVTSVSQVVNGDKTISLLLTVSASNRQKVIETLNACRHAYHRELLKKPENISFLAPTKQDELPDTFTIKSEESKTSIQVVGNQCAINAVLTCLQNGLCEPSQVSNLGFGR